MANNTMYSSLKQYIKRRLGEPVHRVNITGDQLEDCIDEAVQEFIESHACGVNMGFIPLSIVKDQTTYILDDNVQAVMKILSSSNITLDADDPLLIKTFYVGNSVYDMYAPNIVDTEVFRQTFKLVEDQFEIPILFDFNPTTHKLTLDAPPTTNLTAFLKVYASEDNIKLYLKDLWLKKYAVALSRRQWGDNLSKFTNVNLPGGAQFNYETILQRANDDIEKLLEELEDKWSLPIDPMIG